MADQDPWEALRAKPINVEVGNEDPWEKLRAKPNAGAAPTGENPIITKTRDVMTKGQNFVHGLEPAVDKIPGAGWLLHTLEQFANPDNAGSTAGMIAGGLGSFLGPEVAIPAAGVVGSIAANTLGRKPITAAVGEGLKTAAFQGAGEALPFLAPKFARGAETMTAKALSPSQSVLDSMYHPGMPDFEKELVLGRQSLDNGFGLPGTRGAARNAEAHMQDLRGIREAELESLQGQPGINPKDIFAGIKQPLIDAAHQFTGRVTDQNALKGIIRDNLTNPELADHILRSVPGKSVPEPSLGAGTLAAMVKKGIPIPQVELSPAKTLDYWQLKPEIGLDTASKFVTQEGKNLSGTFGDPSVNRATVDLGKLMRANANTALRDKAPGLADVNDWMSAHIPLNTALADAAKTSGGATVKPGEASGSLRRMLGGLVNRSPIEGAIGQALENTSQTLQNPAVRRSVPPGLAFLYNAIFGNGK